MPDKMDIGMFFCSWPCYLLAGNRTGMAGISMPQRGIKMEKYVLAIGCGKEKGCEAQKE